MEPGDKAGARSVTGRPIVGNEGQETAALRPTDSAESNERQLLLRTVPKEKRGGGITAFWGKLAASPSSPTWQNVRRQKAQMM